MPDIDHITLGHARTLLENVDQKVDQEASRLELQMKKLDAENDMQLSEHLQDHNNPHKVTAQQTGADPAGTAAAAVSVHNTSTTAHADLRALLKDLTAQVDAIDDSDDPSLDQMSELVASIKANRAMIESFAGEVDMTQSARITIPVSAWKANTDAATLAEGLAYYADAAVSGLTDADSTETILDHASLDPARESGMSGTTATVNGAIRFYAETIPTEALSATVRIHKDIEE